MVRLLGLLGVSLGAVLLVRARPELSWAASAGRMLMALAACVLAGWLELRIHRWLRGSLGALRWLVAPQLIVAVASLGGLGALACLRAAPALGDHALLASTVAAFTAWWTGAATGSLFVLGNPSARSSLRSRVVVALVGIALLGAAGAVTAARFAAPALTWLRAVLPVFDAWPASLTGLSRSELPLPWVMAVLLLFALPASLSAAGKLLDEVFEQVERVGHALRTGDQDELLATLGARGPREITTLAESSQALVTSLGHRLRLERLFGAQRGATLAKLGEALGGRVPATEVRVASVVVALPRRLASVYDIANAQQQLRLFAQLFESAANAAEKGGGLVERLGTDSLIVVFGAPLDQPDHPTRAAHFAIDLQTSMVSLNKDPELAVFGKRALSIGVATGPLVLGTLEAVAGGGFVAGGDTLQLAHQLATLAEPNEVLVNAINAQSLPMYMPSVRQAEVQGPERSQPVQPFKVWPLPRSR